MFFQTFHNLKWFNSHLVEIILLYVLVSKSLKAICFLQISPKEKFSNEQENERPEKTKKIVEETSILKDSEQTTEVETNQTPEEVNI